MWSQRASRYHDHTAYEQSDGDEASEAGAARLARGMGDKWLVLLHNHGAVVCGTTIQDAYIHNHFLELACRSQIGALAGGSELITPSHELCEERVKMFGRVGLYDATSRDWVAGLALVEQKSQDYTIYIHRKALLPPSP